MTSSLRAFPLADGVIPGRHARRDFCFRHSSVQLVTQGPGRVKISFHSAWDQKAIRHLHSTSAGGSVSQHRLAKRDTLSG
jgi:hypothetical protein